MADETAAEEGTTVGAEDGSADQGKTISSAEFVTAMDQKYGNNHDAGWVQNVTHELLNSGVPDAGEAGAIARAMASHTVQPQYTAVPDVAEPEPEPEAPAEPAKSELDDATKADLKALENLSPDELSSLLKALSKDDA